MGQIPSAAMRGLNRVNPRGGTIEGFDPTKDCPADGHSSNMSRVEPLAPPASQNCRALVFLAELFRVNFGIPFAVFV